jgi:endonuclease-8
VPEGDSLRRAARRLQVLVGEEVEAESPHPRAQVRGVAERIGRRRLLAVEAVGKNLLLHFEGDLVLRSHLRMRGRWYVDRRGAHRVGTPWLVLRGRDKEAVLWHGPVLELDDRAVRRLGPDILDEPLPTERIVANLRRSDARRAIGEALLDQRVVAGIGNLWRAEALWHARVSPWRPIGTISDDELRRVLEEVARLMHASVSGREERSIYRRPGRPCPRCGTPIRSHGQGDDNRAAYWCPTCQPGA